MARQFAPKHFLRMAPNQDLAAYFKTRTLLGAISFDGRDEMDIDEVYDAWQALSPAQRAAVDVDFSAIDSLATSDATATFFAEANELGISFGDEFGREGGYHGKAFSVFLNHHELFERVLQLSLVDNLSLRYWFKRQDLPEVRVPIDEATTTSLASTLRFYFREFEGRGHVCVVEPCQRDGSTYFLCYLEDYGRTDIGFGADDQLERTAKRPVFEVIFLVAPERHALDVFYEGPLTTVRALSKLFARTVFGFDIPERQSLAVYELNALKDRSFQFVYDSSLSITKVAIKLLKFAAVGGAKRKVTLEADPSVARTAIYDFVDEVFALESGGSVASDKLPVAAFNIIQARLQVTFQPVAGRRAPSSTFNVTYPHGCSALVFLPLKPTQVRRRHCQAP